MLRLIAFAVALLALAPIARAQIEIRIDLPTIRFEAPPPLVVVQPGVQVVQDYDEEVFYTGGWYWVRRDRGWYRTHDWHGGWTVATPRLVPAAIVRIEPGRYRKFHGPPARVERREERREERRDERREDREGHDNGRGHGHGRGHGKH